ncbi:hypothetical protein D3C74_478040 [compost metagenome]
MRAVNVKPVNKANTTFAMTWASLVLLAVAADFQNTCLLMSIWCIKFQTAYPMNKVL